MQTEREIREALADARCGRDEAESIINCIRTGNIKKADKLIGISRKVQLERMHDSQRCIDLLDYLRYRLGKV